MNAKTYMLRALFFSCLLVPAVIAVNFLVDPYGIVGTYRVSGLNEYKVDINEHSRLMKKYQSQFGSYNAVIVGNSRVELGIRPSHPCFASGGMSVYNLGLPGADVRTQLEYALNVVYQQPIKTIFLSVDFTDFISPVPPQQNGSATALDTTNAELRYTFAGNMNPDYRLKVFKDYLKSLFSMDALVSSVKTVMLQSHTAPDRDAAGFNPARDFEEAVRVEGPQALFGQKMSDLRAKYSRPWYLRDTDGNLAPAFGELDQFLSVVEKHGIKVYLFTNPFHENYWELLRTQGHMPLYEDWMRSMEELVQRHRGGGAVEFWDFSVDSTYVHELVPESGVKSGPLQWFWEPSHYRRQLGDLMVDAMLSQQCGSAVAFGRQIF